MQKRFTENNIWMMKPHKGTYSALPKKGHLQFFAPSESYEELHSMLKVRLERAARLNPDIDFDIDFQKLYDTYKHLESGWTPKHRKA